MDQKHGTTTKLTISNPLEKSSEMANNSTFSNSFYSVTSHLHRGGKHQAKARPNLI